LFLRIRKRLRDIRGRVLRRNGVCEMCVFVEKGYVLIQDIVTLNLPIIYSTIASANWKGWKNI
jgi:hypothetical protein